MDYKPDHSPEELLASQESPIPGEQIDEALREVKEWMKTL